jgi:hypothetical protein
MKGRLDIGRYEDKSFQWYMSKLRFSCPPPLSRKRSLIISENLRVERIASDEYQHESLGKIKRRLLSNGYPEWFLRQTLRRRINRPQPDFIDFIKVPYFSEAQRKCILSMAHRTNLDKIIRIIFITAKPLAWQFRLKYETQKCPPNCIACVTASRPGRCFTKNAVYKIQCLVCHHVYIGQTGRTMRSRIAEHHSQMASHVYQHMHLHQADQYKNFKWSIISVHPYIGNRLAMEALHIRNCTESIMNGCEGAHLLAFL